MIGVNYFIIFTRFLIALSFLPTGLVKVFRQRLTAIPDTNSVGHLFKKLYHKLLHFYELIDFETFQLPTSFKNSTKSVLVK
ncbi:hypothetical protein GEO21_05130 [Sphingobacterium faecium]|uniref:hypothetical protein n=1 Tax=Sphingobacterium faecium TaxID=34087 RepID=UPI0012922E10|nr:hypothetical protein [Sphingobacterium faecium]MQP26899.1 hypothetical protein [Sphingobacterium faecium]